MNKGYITHTLDSTLHKIGFHKYVHQDDENDYYYKKCYTSIRGIQIELRAYIDILSTDSINIAINGRCHRHGLFKVEQRSCTIEKDVDIKKIYEILDIIDNKLS